MSATPPGLSSDARKQLLFAVRRVLRPIIKLLIRAGISYGEFADLARGVYVESAVRDSADRTGTLSRDRIVLVTGLSRHQVNYYIDNEDSLPAAAPTLARVITEVLHKWHTDPQYLGPYGIPFELEFDGAGGRNFQSIVAQVDSKARAGLVLEELLRSGAVIYSGEKHFRTVSRWFMLPEAFTPHRIEYFGASLTHLAQTLEYNFKFANTEDKRLERFVFADKGLPRALMANFEAYARERATRFLGEVDDWLARYGSADSSQSGDRVDTGVHVFLYVEPTPSPKPLSALVQPPRKVA